MSKAFEISEDDVRNVLSQHGIKLSGAEVTTAFDGLDTGEVEAAALSGDDLDAQTEAAYAEIAKQLTEAGILLAVMAQKG